MSGRQSADGLKEVVFWWPDKTRMQLNAAGLLFRMKEGKLK